MYHDISETELSILQYLWSEGKAKNASEIMEHFRVTDNKEWKKQTLNTFLLRLSNKGCLNVDKSVRKALYYPTITAEEYYEEYAQKILDQSFQGSLANFVSAFAGRQKLSKTEKAELLEYIERL